MKANLKNQVFLLSYYIFSLFFMEVVFRLCTTGELLSYGLLISFLFSIPAALVFLLLTSLFQGRAAQMLGVFLLAASSSIFFSQLVYHNLTGRFYSVFSALNAAGIFNKFWSAILSITVENSFYILIMLLPALLLAAAGQKLFTFEKLSGLHKLILATSIILFHITGLGAVFASGTGQHSARDLYYHSNLPHLSMERLGAITTIRLDFQRNVLGWQNRTDDPSPPSSAEAPGTQGKTSHSSQNDKDKYNIMDIDFDRLIAQEDDQEIKKMHRYFKNVQPTGQNEYTGIYEDYNLILITAESLAPYAVRKDVTPTLHKLVNEGYKFTEFYTPLWGTSTLDGEYVACTGLFPKNNVWSLYIASDNYLPFTLGNQLREKGYKTAAYHNHDYDYYKRNHSHPNMGYDYKGIGNGLDVEEIWPASDLEMFQETVPEYIDDQPFHVYYMTISGHYPYKFSGNNMARKNREHVEHLSYSEEAKGYLASQVELDRALEYLLEKLKEAGIEDKTLIALSSDHYPYGLEDETIEELSGRDMKSKFDLYKNVFILYTGDMEPKTIDKPASSLDMLPTLSNLMGLEYDSRLLMGRDIFSDSEPLVAFLDRSFITGKGRYNHVKDEFTPTGDEEVSVEYINRVLDKIDSKFYYSTQILETDYYKKLE